MGLITFDHLDDRKRANVPCPQKQMPVFKSEKKNPACFI